MKKVIIVGSKGRMGQALLACAARRPDMEVVGQIDQGDDLTRVLGPADVVVDFSLADATEEVARICAEAKKAMVIGTTGHPAEERTRIIELSKRIPMVWASNFSPGVNTLFWLTQKAAEILGEGFDLEVVEMHHRMKQDAPSGTARTLAEILAAARGLSLDQVAKHGRVGMTGARTSEEIGIHSLRGGSVVGEHTVVFSAMEERLELTHRASSRETFANGALRAGVWATQQPPGLYDMRDVLGLK